MNALCPFDTITFLDKSPPYDIITSVSSRGMEVQILREAVTVK